MMMKRNMLLLLCMVFLSTVAMGYDRLIGQGEYVYGLDWTSGLLVVDGGGGDAIEVRGFARVEVHSTSIPVNGNWYAGGITYLVLANSSQLDYYDGATYGLMTGQNATAYLYGGHIDYIKSMQFTETLGAGPHIDLYCQPGWSWISDDRMLGIEGRWMDGSSFSIEFINHDDFDPVYTNINVIIPEPAALLLLGLGGLLIRRKK